MKESEILEKEKTHLEENEGYRTSGKEHKGTSKAPVMILYAVSFVFCGGVLLSDMGKCGNEGCAEQGGSVTRDPRIETVGVPDLRSDPAWREAEIALDEENRLRMGDVAAFYREHYPEYYDGNPELMRVLSEQYRESGKEIVYDRIDAETEAALISASLLNHTDVESEYRVNGIHVADTSLKFLFDRLYRQHMFRYSDGYILAAYNDDEFVRETKLSRDILESVRYVVDVREEWDLRESDSAENSLVFFDAELKQVGVVCYQAN